MRWEDRIGRRLKLRDLHTVQTLAQTGSMAKAAANLSVTQPAVSKAIAEMEAALGVRLFDRKRQGVEPTLYGEALLKGGAAVFHTLNETLKEIQSLADPDAGELAIAGPEPMLAGFVPAAIQRLCKEKPRISFRVVPSGILEELYQSLRSRKLDMVVNRLPQSLPHDLAAEVLLEDPVRVVAGPRNRLAALRRCELADLIDESWVIPGPSTAIGQVIVEIFRASGLPFPRNAIQSNSTQLTLALMNSGHHLGIFPESLMHFSGKRLSIRTLPVKLPIQPPPAGVVTLKNRTMRPVSKLFVDALRTVVKPLAR